jgi:hypothetical protein
LEELSYNVVTFECPLGVGGIGMCCTVHDACYENQMGREKCDNDFCACMTSTLNVLNCRGATVGNFCSIVKLNGGIPYAMAGIKKAQIRG